MEARQTNDAAGEPTQRGSLTDQQLADVAGGIAPPEPVKGQAQPPDPIKIRNLGLSEPPEPGKLRNLGLNNPPDPVRSGP